MYFVHISALQGKGFSNLWASTQFIGERSTAPGFLMRCGESLLGSAAVVDQPDTPLPDWLLLDKWEIENLFGYDCFLVVDKEAGLDTTAVGAIFKTREEAQDYCWNLYLDSLVKSSPDEDPAHNDCFDLVCSSTGVATSSKGVLNWLKIVQL